MIAPGRARSKAMRRARSSPGRLIEVPHQAESMLSVAAPTRVAARMPSPVLFGCEPLQRGSGELRQVLAAHRGVALEAARRQHHARAARRPAAAGPRAR